MNMDGIEKDENRLSMTRDAPIGAKAGAEMVPTGLTSRAMGSPATTAARAAIVMNFSCILRSIGRVFLEDGDVMLATKARATREGS